MVMSVERVGSAAVRLIVPVTEKLIVSSPAPAAHSPDAAPEAVLLLAELIASRSVHWPSFAAASAVLLTLMAANANAGVPAMGEGPPADEMMVIAGKMIASASAGARARQNFAR